MEGFHPNRPDGLKPGDTIEGGSVFEELETLTDIAIKAYLSGMPAGRAASRKFILGSKNRETLRERVLDRAVSLAALQPSLRAAERFDDVKKLVGQAVSEILKGESGIVEEKTGDDNFE